MSVYKKHKSKLALLGALFVLAVAGYIAGFFLQKEHTSDTSLIKSSVAFVDAKTTKKEPPPLLKDIQGKVYNVTYPSIGPLINTISATRSAKGLTLTINGDQNAPTNKIKQGQNIAFYSPNEDFLTAGVITEVIQGNDNKDMTLTYLFHDQDAPELSAQDFSPIADIIVSETGPLKRIPLSSVIEQNGHSFIFVSKDQYSANDDKTIALSIVKQPINAVLKDNWFVEIGNTIKSTDLVIINPDQDLKESESAAEAKVIKAQVISLKDPIPDNTTIWIDNAVAERTKSIEANKKAAENCSLASAVKAASDETNKSDDTNNKDQTPNETSDTQAPPFDAYELLDIEKPTPKEILEDSNPTSSPVSK